MLIWNQRHLLHALRENENFYNEQRPQQGIAKARLLAPRPEPITDPHQLAHLNICRRDRLGGILHEYECRLTSTDVILGKDNVQCPTRW